MEQEKNKNTESRSKRKWWVSAQPTYSPQGNGLQAPGWNPTRMITKGAGIVKGWEAKQDLKCIPDTFTHNKNDTITDPLAHQQMNQNSPYPIGDRA